MHNKFVDLVLIIVLRRQTPKAMLGGGWLHFTDTSEPVVGYGANNMVSN
jgi:hypothetical protein